MNLTTPTPPPEQDRPPSTIEDIRASFAAANEAHDRSAIMIDREVQR